MKTQTEMFLDRSFFSEKPLIPLLVGTGQCEPSHRFGPYFREYYLLHYCVSGKGTFEIGGKKYPVSQGQIFIIPPDVLTVYEADEKDPWQYTWVAFVGGNAEKLNTLSPVVRYEADTFARIAGSVYEKNSNPELYAAYIHEILYNLFGKTETPLDICRRVRDEINLSYMKPLSVESLACDVGLNRRYLSRIFKEKYGIPLKEYLIGVRMRRAAELLQKGYTVSESAYMVGYGDVFNFSKMFRKVIGVSPSEYRQKSRVKN